MSHKVSYKERPAKLDPSVTVYAPSCLCGWESGGADNMTTASIIAGNHIADVSREEPELLYQHRLASNRNPQARYGEGITVDGTKDAIEVSIIRLSGKVSWNLPSDEALDMALNIIEHFDSEHENEWQ